MAEERSRKFHIHFKELRVSVQGWYSCTCGVIFFHLGESFMEGKTGARRGWGRDPKFLKHSRFPRLQLPNLSFLRVECNFLRILGLIFSDWSFRILVKFCHFFWFYILHGFITLLEHKMSYFFSLFYRVKFGPCMDEN